MKASCQLRRLAWLFGVLLLACATVPARAADEYQTVEVESLKITIDSEWGMRTAPGYLPVRFDITNLGEARVIDIVGHGSRFFRGRRAGPASTGVRQTVRLARGDRVRLTVPVPIFAHNEHVRFEVHEGGRTLERFHYTGLMSASFPHEVSALIVADPASAFGRVAADWRRTISASSSFATSSMVTSGTTSTTRSIPGGVPTQHLDFLLDPARLPDNWLGFTSLRAVVVGPREWQQLNDAQKSALLTWTACGGDLILVDGDLTALFPPGQQPPVNSTDRAVGAYFFGRIHLSTSASMAAGGLSSALSKTEARQDSNWALPANRARDWGVIASRGFRLPIPGVDGVPARAYLFILIAFSVLIGPANFWFLQRRGQRVLLVLTAPLISAGFILMLAAYVVAGEGLGVRGRAVTFTMLDQIRKQAATRASVSLYAAGMTPAGGLRYPRDHAVFTIGPDGTGSRESQTLDLSDSQRFSAGAIQARTPTNLETIGFRPARERLSFNREAEAVTVVNGLGATIAALIYREGNAVYSLAAPLLAGGKATLKPGAPRAADIVPPGLPLSRFQHLVDHPPDGSYLAVLDRSPFWDPGVPSVDERDSFHLVFGWLRGQP